jgi:hypothetical protein
VCTFRAHSGNRNASARPVSIVVSVVPMSTNARSGRLPFTVTSSSTRQAEPGSTSGSTSSFPANCSRSSSGAGLPAKKIAGCESTARSSSSVARS